VIFKPRTTRRPRSAGGALKPTVIALVMLALAGGLVLAVFLQQSGRGATDPVVDPEAQDRELAVLQEMFKETLEGGGDIRNMLPDVTDFIDRYPDNIDGHILHAQVLLKMEQWSLAYPPLALAVDERGDDFELLKLTGMCAGKLSKWEAAQTYLEAADAMRKDVTVMLALGNVYYQTGQYEAALIAYQDAHDNFGQMLPHKAFSGLADVYDAMGNREDADENLRRADRYVQEDSETDKWTYRLQRVRITMERGEWDDAKQMLNQVAGDYTAAIYTLPYARLNARRHEHEGRPEKAVGGFLLVLADILFRDEDEEAVTIGYHADVLAELAQWQIRAGKETDAAATIRDLKTLNATHPALVDLEAALAN